MQKSVYIFLLIINSYTPRTTAIEPATTTAKIAAALKAKGALAVLGSAAGFGLLSYGAYKGYYYFYPTKETPPSKPCEPAVLRALPENLIVQPVESSGADEEMGNADETTSTSSTSDSDLQAGTIIYSSSDSEHDAEDKLQETKLSKLLQDIWGERNELKQQLIADIKHASTHLRYQPDTRQHLHNFLQSLQAPPTNHTEISHRAQGLPTRDILNINYQNSVPHPYAEGAHEGAHGYMKNTFYATLKALVIRDEQNN